MREGERNCTSLSLLPRIPCAVQAPPDQSKHGGGPMNTSSTISATFRPASDARQSLNTLIPIGSKRGISFPPHYYNKLTKKKSTLGSYVFNIQRGEKKKKKTKSTKRKKKKSRFFFVFLLRNKTFFFLIFYEKFPRKKKKKRAKLKIP